MALADYAHHNEEAERIWWEEEGKHEPMQSEEYGREDAYSAADAYAEELGEASDDELNELAVDDTLTPGMKACVEWEIKHRRGAA